MKNFIRQRYSYLVKLVLRSPTQLRIDEPNNRLILQSDLKYKDRRAEYDYKRLLHNRFLRAKYGEEKFAEELAKIKASIHNTLLMQDDNGDYTYSGMAHRLLTKFGGTLENRLLYPEPKLIPWDHVPEHPLREYQQEAVEKLLEARHAAIELPTGSGKSRVIVQLAKRLGLPMVVVAPTTNIADQLLKDFVYYFGRKYVGQYYGGKKQIDKLFTIAIGASIVRVRKGSDDWHFFSGTKVLVGDESHTLAADTLSYMCLEVFQNAPYRFFTSATQTRTDGLDLLLEGITGPIVYSLKLRELVERGYLAKPIFRIVRVDTETSYVSSDPMRMNKRHLYYNKNVNRICGKLANKCVDTGRPTLILVDEVEQFSALLPYLRHEARFAHGGLTKDNKKRVPSEYHKSDPAALVKQFNNGVFPILVGTSCVSVGTDFQNVGAVHYLVGGTSEIAVSQAVGRGTRGGFNGVVYMPNGEKKLDFLFFDYMVGSEDLITYRHAMARKKIYDDLYGEVKFIDG